MLEVRDGFTWLGLARDECSVAHYPLVWFEMARVPMRELVFEA
jgi:hypothetical protein